MLNEGSISKSGQLGYKKNIESIDDCGQLCDAKEYCCAFEYSDSKKRCYMNVDCNPTRPVNKNYDYCMKEVGKFVFFEGNSYELFIETPMDKLIVKVIFLIS